MHFYGTHMHSQLFRVHIMSGKLDSAERLSSEQSQCLQTLESNLRLVLPELEKRNIVGLIEPINNQTVPGYILNNYDLGTETITLFTFTQRCDMTMIT